MPSQVEEIKERLDIVQVVSEYLQLKKAGANWRARCPFHSEKTPSFFVSPARQIFKCFGCSKSGDIFGFVMAMERVEFPEALQILAKKAGVELKKEPIQIRTERQKQYEICEIAARFFERQLEGTRIGKEAEDYLKKRGLSEESIKNWRLGYAPDTWRGLSDFLVGRGYKREEIIKAGLAIEQATGDRRQATSYDRFRGRIMFPIFDLHKNVVGFGGRIFEQTKNEKRKTKNESEAKYINTPNTLIYDKSRILYGLNKAKMNIREGNGAVLVEGYTDVVLSHQAGVRNVMATSGTALTPYHLKILSRYTKEILLAFDMDIGGEEATKRGIDIAQSYDFNIKLISLPEGKDPADIIRENPQDWQGAVEKAEEIVSFYFSQVFSRFDKETIEGKKKISEIILPYISRLKNKIEQAHWIQKLAGEFKVKEDVIWEEIKRKHQSKTDKPGFYQSSAFAQRARGQYNGTESAGDDKANPEKSMLRKLEERFLMVLLYLSKKDGSKDGFKEYIKEAETLPNLSFKEGQELFDKLVKFAGEEKSEADKKSFFLNPQLSDKLTKFVSELEFQFELESGKIGFEKEIGFCIKKIKEIYRKEKTERIIGEIREAENSKDKIKVSKLLEELRNINW